MKLYKNILMGVLISAIAAIIQLVLWKWLSPLIWLCFYPAIFFSARFGGISSSLATTTSALLIVYLIFLPPEFSWQGKNLHPFLSAPIFIITAYLVAEINQRNKKLTQHLSEKYQEAETKRIEAARIYDQELNLDDLKFSQFAESLPQIVWVTDEEGKNIYFNSKWMTYTGMTIEESLGHGWNIPFHPDDQQLAWDAWQNAVKNFAPYSLECRLRRGDGQYRWWLIRGSPLIDSTGIILKWFGTCTDIQEIKEREKIIFDEKQKLEAIFNNHPDGVAIINRDGQYTSINSNYKNLFGFKSNDHFPETTIELLSICDLFDINGNHLHPASMPLPRALQGAITSNFIVEFNIKSKNKKIITSISASPLKNIENQITGAIASVRDITTFIDQEIELKRLFSEQSSIINSGIAGISKTKNRSFLWINEIFAKNFGYEINDLIGKSCEILYKDNADYIKFGECISDAKFNHPVRKLIELKKKDGSTGWFLVGGGPISPDSDESIWISFDVTEDQKNRQLLETYAKRLEMAMHETLEVLSKTIELHDPYTAGHQYRVGEIAHEIGRVMGLCEKNLESLRLIGLMHDIGKIGIPAEILSKPGKLSPEQMALVQTHTRIGYEILKQIHFDIPIADVALEHHERLDGSGYPQALKDSNILLEARIIAVADVVEAMSSHRPYRQSLGLDKALEEIEQGRGVKYDSQAVDACLKLFREEGYRLPQT